MIDISLVTKIICRRREKIKWVRIYIKPRHEDMSSAILPERLVTKFKVKIFNISILFLYVPTAPRPRQEIEKFYCIIDNVKV